MSAQDVQDWIRREIAGNDVVLFMKGSKTMPQCGFSMQVAQKYGMIMPGEDSSKAVRAVFVVDPKGTIRAIIYYPLSLGRNFDELLRVVKGLQTADHFSVATPADWKQGDDVIITAAVSNEDALGDSFDTASPDAK